MKKRIVRLVGVTVVGLGILTTACGSDDSTSDGSEATVEETTTTASEPAATTEKPATTTSESTATTEPPAATAGSEVTIDVLEEEDPGGWGPFTASGVAVEEGIICPSGPAHITEILDADSGEPQPWSTVPENLLVDWLFTCDDGSGEFTLTLAQPAYTDADHERFIATGGTGEIIDDGQIWETQSGTDAYVGLSGEGTYTFEVLDASGRPSRATWTGTLALS